MPEPRSPVDGDPADVLCTPADYVRWAASCFEAAGLSYGHGLDNALDEAFYLVRSALHLPHELPEVYLRARLLPAERQRLIGLIEARVTTRKPVAYLLGEAWFCGMRFRVDERVIVPRSPLAELIMEGFEPWVAQPPRRILDLCAGSGCIAIACATAFPEAEVHAVELDDGAAELMDANIADHGLGGRVHAHRGDLFEPLRTTGVKPFDLIVTNPPYVPDDEWAALPAEYHAEPRLALAAGADGMEVVDRLLHEAPGFLASGGMLVGEVGASVAPFMARFAGLPAHWPEFAHGGSGVFVIERDDLVDWLQGERDVG
ncbi:50S ribosomal protein L3 N(5)-glutamine methyltransferase [Algiphilus sp.]|uniref:50S ribosomal protein L3 N(5)-glutamine methyltransferase n=1 Tax=Algiphilus sp. TaxID=1872431 RepID=UPI003C48EA85